MNIGIIGTGGRSLSYLELLLMDDREDVIVSALADVDLVRLKKYVEINFLNKKEPELYTDYKLLLRDKNIDTVIICTPDTTHKEIAVEAMRSKKHILLEKPFATSINDCVDIYRQSINHSKAFRLGFVLRHTDFYRRIKEIVSNGVIGRVISLEAKEMLGHMHAGSFFRRWHRFKKNNGGFLNAKCSHDLDILNWIIDDEPRYVSAFGSRSYFNPVAGAADSCPACRLKNNCRYYYKESYYGPLQAVGNNCVFNCEKDIVDHEVVNIQYRNGITASFTVTMLSADANRTMVIFGTEATLYADFHKKSIKVKFIHPSNEITYAFEDNDTGHGGGDRGIYEDFTDRVRQYPKFCISDARAGLLSSAIALAAELSIEERRIVDISSYIDKTAETFCEGI